MGPDLLGMVGATAFIVVVLAAFGLVDRVLCGAWDALLGSPGSSLVAGMTAWASEARPRHIASSPCGADGAPPVPPDPVATEPVRAARIAPHSGVRLPFAA